MTSGLRLVWFAATIFIDDSVVDLLTWEQPNCLTDPSNNPLVVDADRTRNVRHDLSDHANFVLQLGFGPSRRP